MTGLAISPSKLFCNLSAPNVAISVYDAPLPPVLRESLSRRQQFSVSESGIDAGQVISEGANEGLSRKSLQYKELQN